MTEKDLLREYKNTISDLIKEKDDINNLVKDKDSKIRRGTTSVFSYYS